MQIGYLRLKRKYLRLMPISFAYRKSITMRTSTSPFSNRLAIRFTQSGERTMTAVYLDLRLKSLRSLTIWEFNTMKWQIVLKVSWYASLMLAYSASWDTNKVRRNSFWRQLIFTGIHKTILLNMLRCTICLKRYKDLISEFKVTKYQSCSVEIWIRHMILQCLPSCKVNQSNRTEKLKSKTFTSTIS